MIIRVFAALTGCVLVVAVLNGQTKHVQLQAILAPTLQTPDMVSLQLRQFLEAKVPILAPPPASANEWTAQAGKIRTRVLDGVVFHGWPREWVQAPPRFEDLGTMPSGQGYRLRKLRYEIVPGFYGAAILYEPEGLAGKVPAILNFDGHVGPIGKAIEYSQKRCISQARQGILALHLEWLSFGELKPQGNEHWTAAHLDLVGANGVGLFYLAMRKGLDYLENHPNVDKARLGVTGLSGGGWQTIILSALDDRVAVSVPVAGYSTIMSRLERQGDIGDLEQNATDLLRGQDYSHFTAMRAPKPTFLIYNAEDDCCFKAALVKPYIFDAIQPFFRLYRAESSLAWHENTDRGDHNYQADNRLQSYRFFAKHFGLPPVDREAPVAADIKSYDELVVGLPADNLTILGVARRLAASIAREPIPADEGARQNWAATKRPQLKEVVRLKDTDVRHAWALTSTKSKGLETQAFRFEFTNGLSATAILGRALTARENAPVTIVLNDAGKKDSAIEASDRINHGDQVLAVDLVLTGDAAPLDPTPYMFAQMIATVGERPLGLEAAQLSAISRWAKTERHGESVRVETLGLRSQVVALVAGAINPGSFSEVVVANGMPSLGDLLAWGQAYESAPDLFCLDLYKEFDVDALIALAGPTAVSFRPRLEAPF